MNPNKIRFEDLSPRQLARATRKFRIAHKRSIKGLTPVCGKDIETARKELSLVFGGKDRVH